MAQAVVLQPDLNDEAIDYFKIIRDGKLVYMDGSTQRWRLRRMIRNSRNSVPKRPRRRNLQAIPSDVLMFVFCACDGVLLMSCCNSFKAHSGTHNGSGLHGRLI